MTEESNHLSEEEKERYAKGCCGGCLILLLAPIVIGVVGAFFGVEATCPSAVDKRRAMNENPTLFKRYVIGSEYSHCR